MMQPTNVPEPTFNPEQEKLDEIRAEIDQFGQAETFVTDEGKAGWAFRELAKVARENQKTRDQADLAIKQIEQWRDAKVSKNDSWYATLEHQLLAYSENQRQKDPKYRLDTPFGKVTIRTTKMPKAKIADATQVLNFVKANWNPHMQDEVIKRTEKVGITDLKPFIKIVGDKAVDEDGQVIPGVTIEPAGKETSAAKPTPITEVL
jgi:hypothetical protein